MSKIYGLLMILVSSDGILSATRDVVTTAGDVIQGQYMTDPSSPSEYMKQQLKNYEESVGISHDYGTHSGSDSNTGSASEVIAPVVKEAPKETGTLQPLEELHDSTKQSLATNERKSNSKPSTKEFESIKYNKGLGTSEKQNPGSFAMRISAEMVEIDIAKTSTENPSRAENSTMRSVLEGIISQSNVADDPVLELKKPSTDKVNEEIDVVQSVTTADPVDEEIRKVLDSLPKLPEITFSDNNTHFAYHKDPEEAALDDSITQVARQLAETSLRHQYEEKKLGHYIPIRLRQFDENYPSNSYSPLRRLSTSKTFSNPFNIILEIRQEPQVRFKALPLPQHIYNGPIFIPKDLGLSPSSTETVSETAEGAYVTKTNPNLNADIKRHFNPEVDTSSILQLGPRYVLPTSRNGIGNNRIPILLHMTPAQQLQEYYNQNDLNGYA